MISISYFIQENIKQYKQKYKEKKTTTTTTLLIIQQQDQQYPVTYCVYRIEEEGKEIKDNDQINKGNIWAFPCDIKCTE